MAGKIGVKISKNVGGGLRGSTSGLRFNPREAPEFAEEDRNLGRDDPEGKERYEEKKRKERETRHKKIAGLHHINIKIPKKSKAQGDNQRNDERLSEMTGPASSTGYPLDVATGAKTGGGSAMGGPNIMTGEPMGVYSDILKFGFLSAHSGRSRGRHGLTETIGGQRAVESARATHRRRRQIGRTTESAPYEATKGLTLNNTKTPHLQPTRMATILKRVKATLEGIKIRRGIKVHGKGFTGHGGAFQGDFRKQQESHSRNRIHRREGSGRKAARATSIYGAMPKSPSGGGGGSHNAWDSHGVSVPTPSPTPGTPRASYTAGTPRSVSGMKIEEGSSPTAMAGSGGMVGSGAFTGPTKSEDILQEAEDLLRKASLSQADLTEFKWLVRELRRLIRSGPLRKAGLDDAEHDDERPTPNAHRRTTSSPTGATSVDPDDDPRFWGAHPMGLLLPRRGHQ